MFVNFALHSCCALLDYLQTVGCVYFICNSTRGRAEWYSNAAKHELNCVFTTILSYIHIIGSSVPVLCTYNTHTHGEMTLTLNLMDTPYIHAHVHNVIESPYTI